MRAPTLDEWNSDAFRQLHLTSETLTWDPTTTLYEDQELAMTDYSGNVVRRVALRGQVSSLVINSLSSLTADYADVTDNNNFYWVLSSLVQISSTEPHHQCPNHIALPMCPPRHCPNAVHRCCCHHCRCVAALLPS